MHEVGTQIHLEEDKHVEFKMHTRHLLSEIPANCSRVDNGRIVRTMQPTSKTICAYLNTEGGNLYFGVDDDGVLRGMRMTRCERDHFILALHHCLNQFSPPVLSELVKVRFDEVKQKTQFALDREYVTSSHGIIEDDSSEEDALKDIGFSTSELVEDWYVRKHFVGGTRCACFQRAMSSKLYLITLQISKSSDGTIYQNDEGLVYRRMNGSNRMVCLDDLRQYMDTVLIGEPFPPVRYHKVTWFSPIRRALLNIVTYFTSIPFLNV